MMGDYGWLLFICIPLFIGFLPGYFAGKSNNLKKSEYYNLGFITLLTSCIGILIFALEGLICILMASPLLLLFVALGAHLAFKTNETKKISNTNITLLVLCLSITFLSFDYINDKTATKSATSYITIDAPIETVWHNVVSFNKIDTPLDWIFKTGLAYPIDAKIIGTGVGAVRYCNFSTGSFVEPITTWKEPHLLQFDVEEQPIPMNEFNPFWDVHPPHLDGYFKSQKGEFKLISLSNGKTKLAGTTWYTIDIYPNIYWQTWTDYIVHKIHGRVLDHIKSESEKE